MELNDLFPTILLFVKPVLIVFNFSDISLWTSSFICEINYLATVTPVLKCTFEH
jgi:hypothetical protein